jgi:MarR family transcriptional regulator, organic hydroperoxide resistance regulator
MALTFNIFPKSESPGFLIYLATTQLKAGLHRAFQSHGFNVTPEQWTVLSSLWEADSVHQTLLAEKTAKDRHNITRILSLLEKGGLVQRRHDQKDRRCRTVYLTKEGKALKPHLVGIATEFMEESLAGLTQGDLDALTRTLGQIIENVSRNSKGAEISRSLRYGGAIQRQKLQAAKQRHGDFFEGQEIKKSHSSS